jgi:hypothetical protein
MTAPKDALIHPSAKAIVPYRHVPPLPFPWGDQGQGFGHSQIGGIE